MWLTKSVLVVACLTVAAGRRRRQPALVADLTQPWPRHVPDPAASPPADWDPGEDGPWGPPLIDNPEPRPLVRNPLFAPAPLTAELRALAPIPVGVALLGLAVATVDCSGRLFRLRLPTAAERQPMSSQAGGQRALYRVREI